MTSVEKTDIHAHGKSIVITMDGVYNYRNRWVWGKISGVLDLHNRKFTQSGRKFGYCTIKTYEDAYTVKEACKDYVPLKKFLFDRIIRDAKEVVFLERLILKGANIKKIWVEPESVVN